MSALKYNPLAAHSYCNTLLFFRNRNLKLKIHSRLQQWQAYLRIGNEAYTTSSFPDDSAPPSLEESLAIPSIRLRIVAEAPGEKPHRKWQNHRELFMGSEFVALYSDFLACFNCLLNHVCLPSSPLTTTEQKLYFESLLEIIIPLLNVSPNPYEQFKKAHQSLSLLIKSNTAPKITQETRKIQPNPTFFKPVVDCLSVITRRLSSILQLALVYAYENDYAEFRFYKRKLIDLIETYICEKEKELEMCLSCEKMLPAQKMTKHIQLCQSIYDTLEYIDQLDAEVAARVQDLKQHIAYIKKIQKEKEAEKERQKIRLRTKETLETKPKSTKPFYSKGLSKTCIYKSTKNQYDNTTSSNSDSECSSSTCTKGPSRLITELSLQQITAYMGIVDQLRQVGNKIKTQRKISSLQLVEDLKDIKNSIAPKLKTMNLHCEEVTKLMQLLLIRLDYMEKERKLKKQVEKEGGISKNKNGILSGGLWNEFEQLNNKRSMNSRKKTNRFKYSLNDSYYSEEEATPRSASQERQEISTKDFKKIKMLGRGKFGEVYLVVKKTTGYRYAMKKVLIENKADYTEALHNENNVFSVISSPYLVKAVYSFSQGRYHYFVMEYMPNGDLYDLLEQLGRLEEFQAKIYLAEVVTALEYLHKHGIIHRDLKPQNIVLDQNKHLKLADYGLSEAGLLKRNKEQLRNRTLSKFILNEMNARAKHVKNEEEPIVGSPYYMAPEILKGERATQMSDWWSLGILAFHLIVGTLPYNGNSREQIFNSVFRHETWPSVISFGRGEDEITPQAKDLIDGLLNLNPKDRLGKHVEDIKDHPFFNGVDWDNLLETQIDIEFDHIKETEEVESIDDNDGYATDEEVGDKTVGGTVGNVKLIRRDILNTETQARHQRGEQRNRRLRNFAEKLRRQVGQQT